LDQFPVPPSSGIAAELAAELQRKSRGIYFAEKGKHAQPTRRDLVARAVGLARSTCDLFGIVKRIVDAKAQLRSLAEPWADTGTSTGRVMLAYSGASPTWSGI
jgi:hypothetical protein